MRKQLKHIIYILIILSLSACNNANDTSIKNNNSDYIISENDIDINEGKKWLKENMESYFNNDEKFMKGFSSLCTTQYYEFKQDATNIDLDGGMSEEAFKTKWGSRYSKYAGIGDGFMIAGNDYGKIELTKIEFKNRTEMGGLRYDVLITDTVFNSKFQRQIIIMKENDHFLIDDVLEISNEFEKVN
jgi:hypothetical protein